MSTCNFVLIVVFSSSDQKHKWWAKVKFMCHGEEENPLRIEAKKSSKPESVFFSPAIFNLCFIVHFVLVFSSSSDLTWCRVSHSSFLFASLWTCNSLVGASKIYFPFLCIFSVLFFSRCFSSMMHHNGVVILVFTFFFRVVLWELSAAPNLHFVVGISLFLPDSGHSNNDCLCFV